MYLFMRQSKFNRNFLDEMVIPPFCKGRGSRNVKQPWPDAARGVNPPKSMFGLVT